MSSQVNGSPLFTIEQIELIRRLRNSGITKEQIIQAFDSLERLDRELGPVYNVPVTLTVSCDVIELINVSSFLHCRTIIIDYPRTK